MHKPCGSLSEEKTQKTFTKQINNLNFHLLSPNSKIVRWAENSRYPKPYRIQWNLLTDRNFALRQGNILTAREFISHKWPIEYDSKRRIRDS